MKTLWETICLLSGPNGADPVSIHDAVSKSAVTEGIAGVEIEEFEKAGFIRKLDSDRIALTPSGQVRRANLHQTSVVTDVP